MAADADDTRPAAPGIRPMTGSLRRFPADADDARPTVFGIRPMINKVELLSMWIQKVSKLMLMMLALRCMESVQLQGRAAILMWIQKP